MIPERATEAAERVLGWLRAGYPEGETSGEYVALFGVLHRRLDAEEVEHVSRDLIEQATQAATGIDEADVRDAITELVREEAGPEDVEGVIQCLAARGWVVTRPA
jgi:hypothetical protein